MASAKKLQTNFSAGELAPELGMRQDTEQYANGAKSLLNRRCLIGGGTTRRPGTSLLAALIGPPRAIEFIVNLTTSFVCVFSDARVDIYSKAGVLLDTLTGCAWTGDIWETMDYTQTGNTMFLTHIDMPVQTLVRTDDTTWTASAMTFFTSGTRTEQPYFKVAPPGMTLTPSAISGNITLTTSAPYWVPAHVGTIVRYYGREIEITGYVSPTVVNATVLETLPITQRLTVGSTTIFAVGDVVEGATSTAKGDVINIVSGTQFDVIISEQLTPFTTEVVIGPNGRATTTAASTIAPGAAKQWDEQVFSAVNGYPACVAIHRSRLLFGGCAAAPTALIGSVIDNLYNFNVGTGGDADAIFELIGDSGASAIVQLHSAEQLIVLTDHGPYYIPESAQLTFKPTSIAFFPFGSPWPISATVKAHEFDNGVLVASGSLIIKLKPSGNQQHAWEGEEVSLLSSHIINTPTHVAVTSNFADGPERYAMFINTDGTMFALQLVEDQKIRNMTPWETTGTITSICAIQAQVFITTLRDLAGAPSHSLELFDQEVTLDCATEYADEVTMDAGVPVTYGATEVNVVVTPTYHLGTWPLALTSVPAGPYVVGMYFDATIETMPPVIDGREGSQAGEWMRIARAYVHVLESARFTASGYTLTAYQTTDDVTAAPPLRTGPQMFEFLGWEREPTLTISQSDPLPLTVLAIKLEVAF